MKLTISIYYLIIIFLTTLGILGSLQFGPLPVVKQIVPVVIVTTLTDSIIKYLKLKYWKISLSAAITGLIIGLTGQFGENPWILILIGIAAMLIKFFVKIEGRHIFNPAASGLLTGMLFFNSYPSWWVGGENFWIFLIWIPILLYKMRRWAPMAGFLLPVTLFNGVNILTSASLLFFVSVMLIEPKTSPATTKLGLIYGLVVAVSYLAIGRFFQFDPLLVGLLIANLTARLLGKYI